MGSAPACLMDSPQHQFCWYGGCCNEFLGITICWDNDFRCTGHFSVPALLQHLRVILLTLQTGKLRHRAGSGEGLQQHLQLQHSGAPGMLGYQHHPQPG